MPSKFCGRGGAMRTYYKRTFKWIKKERGPKTRAYKLFHYGQIMIGTKLLQVTPTHIDYWLRQGIIREVENA